MSKIFNIVVNKSNLPKDVFIKESTLAPDIAIDGGVSVLLGSDFIYREEPFIIETTSEQIGNIKIVVEKIYNPGSLLMRYTGYIEKNLTIGEETSVIQIPMFGNFSGAEETLTAHFYTIN